MPTPEQAAKLPHGQFVALLDQLPPEERCAYRSAAAKYEASCGIVDGGEKAEAEGKRLEAEETEAYVNRFGSRNAVFCSAVVKVERGEASLRVARERPLFRQVVPARNQSPMLASVICAVPPASGAHTHHASALVRVAVARLVDHDHRRV